MRYTLLLILFFLFSCRNTHHDVKLLREAETLSDSIPKEALTKLQAIKNSGNLPNADQAKLMEVFENLKANLVGKNARIVLPEGEEPRILQATKRLVSAKDRKSVV